LRGRRALPYANEAALSGLAGAAGQTPKGRNKLAQGKTLCGYVFIIHYSLFIIHYPLFIIHYSLFITHYSLFIIHYSLAF
jgi:hypothetical protein